MDQIEPLAELCSALKEKGFHIILFTHFELVEIMAEIQTSDKAQSYIKMLHNIDVLIDGKYDDSQRIYDESLEDGLHDAIGSRNQVVWDFEEWRRKSENGNKEHKILGMKAGDLAGLYVCPNGELRYVTYDFEAAYEELQAALA